MTEDNLSIIIRAMNDKLVEFEDENMRLSEAHNRVVQDNKRLRDAHQTLKQDYQKAHRDLDNARSQLDAEKQARQRDQGEFHRRIREQESYYKSKQEEAVRNYSSLFTLGEKKSQTIAELRKENYKLRTFIARYPLNNPTVSQLKSKNNQLMQQKRRWKAAFLKEQQEHTQTRQDWVKHWNGLSDKYSDKSREIFRLKKEIEDLRKQLEQTAQDALSVESQYLPSSDPKEPAKKLSNIRESTPDERLQLMQKEINTAHRRLSYLENYVYAYDRNDGE